MRWRTIWIYLPTLIPIVGIMVFVGLYGISRYPYADTTIANGDTAILTADNRLSIQDLFTSHYRHRVIFTRLTSALLTALTDWDVRYEVMLNVALSIINCGLVAVLLRQFWGKFAPLLLFITTFLILNLDQALNWLSGLQTSWGFVTLFTLFAIYLIQKPLIWRFLGAVICGICATVSLGNGIVIWAILLMILALNRRDTNETGIIKIGQYCIILGFGGFFALVTLQSGLDIQGNHYQSFQIGDIPHIIYLWLLMLGRPILNTLFYSPIPDTPREVYFAVAGTHWMTIIPALIGLGLLLYGLWRVYHHDGIKALATPTSIALYSAGGLGMIAFITVLQSITAHTDSVVIALNDRYMHLSLLFWVITISITFHNLHFLPRKMIFIHIGIVSLIFIGHIFTLIREIPLIGFNELAFPLDDALKNGECAQNYPLTGDMTCIYANWMTDWDNLNQLASRRLAGYAHLPIQTIIPYLDAGDVVIINSESAWQGIHLRDFFLNKIPYESLIHIAPQPSQAILADIEQSPTPPEHLLLGDTTESHEALQALLADKSGAWYVVRPPRYQGEIFGSFRDDLEAIFAPAGYFITSDNIQVTRYIRPFHPLPVAIFGDTFTLMQWQGLGKEFAVCNTLTLQTAWTINAPQAQTVHLSLALVDYPITHAIVTADAPISPIPVPFWDVNMPYYDERYLTIPCDLDSGNYALTLTLYGITDGGEILPNLSVNSVIIPIEGHLLVIQQFVIP